MTLLRKLAWLVSRRRKEQDLADELQFHLEAEARERREDGVPENEARSEARRSLGNRTRIEEETRAAWGWAFLDRLRQDLRYVARTIAKNPAFTILASLSLALGIGANTAIYSFMDALLVRSLPVPDPQSLVVLNWHTTAKKNDDSVVHDVSGSFYQDPKTGRTTGIFPYPAFELLRRTNVFSILFAYRPADKMTLLIGGRAEAAGGEYVSGDFFRGLELAPAAGRLIDGEDDRAGAAPVIVLSYRYAQQRFGDPAKAAGQPLRIDNVPFTSVGVTPPGFFGVEPGKSPDFYLPLHADLVLEPDHSGAAYLDEHRYWIEMMGRLRPGVGMPAAQSALAPVFEQWVASTADNDRERANLPQFLLKAGAGGLDHLRREFSRPLYVLLAMVALILAIACANVANLLLARAAARRREIAVRLSVGAGRGRVIRQLLTESIVLASIGGASGILLAILGLPLLNALLTGGSDLAFDVAVNWHVLAAAIALTAMTGVLFGLAPALQSTRVDLHPALKEAREPSTRSEFSLSRMLVAAQIAISLLLLMAAGLFVRTLRNLQSIDMGFERDNILSFTVNARQAGYREPEILSFYGDLEKRFASIPGVRGASVANSPLIGEGAWGWPVIPVGRPRPEHAPSGHGSGGAASATHVLAVGPAFFATMRIALAGGREFDERDRPGSQPVAIVNEAWVKANLENRNPVGQHVVSFAPHAPPREMQIVGIAKNSRYDDLAGEFPAIVYLPFEQDLGVPAEEMTFLLRTTGDPLHYAKTVEEIVRQADDRIPVTHLATQSELIDQQMSEQILFARLCSGFAVLALVIAGVGLYGTMSYIVARRTGEIGIRIALGARRGSVVWMILRQVVAMAAAGLAIGIPVAFGLSRLVASLLYGVKGDDPTALGFAVTMLLAAVLIAGCAPARKASRIDPLRALRHE